jgi:hypothetical protein
LFALRRVQRCHEFYTSRKGTILKESQHVTSLAFNITIPIRPQKCLDDRWQMVFQRRGRPSPGTNHMITTFFTGCKLIVFNILSKESKFKHSHFDDYFLPIWKEKTWIFIGGSRGWLLEYIWTIHCALMD